MPDAGSAPGQRTVERHTRLGPYRICLEVASGGMATVYLGRSPARVGRDRFVALKVAHPHLARDTTFLDMFTDEARLASRIHHPNVCRVLDFDGAAREPYLAMEFLSGENLASVFGRYAQLTRAAENGEALKLDLERHASLTARVMADACAGLHAAHELRDDDGEPLHVVHRDVSPENIFLTYDGVVKIVDFGVARTARQHHRTSTGFVKGKLAYLQPEALKGSKLDRRADVWGIGVTLWELLTGKRLFRREGDLETLRAVDDHTIAPPSVVRPGLPPALDPIVMRALARDPDERYATTRELGRALLAALPPDRRVPDMVDLADWMDELFPGGRSRANRLLEFAERIAEDCAAANEAIECDEPTRLRSVASALPLQPPQATSWPLVQAERQPTTQPRRGVVSTGLGAAVGLVAGVLGTWLAVSAHAASSDKRTSSLAQSATVEPRFSPSATLIRDRQTTDAVPFGLARSWADGAPVDEREQYDFAVPEDTEEIVLRFRRARRPSSAEAR